MIGDTSDEAMLIKAREAEMSELRRHSVNVKVPLQECVATTGRGPIGAKWIDINKGD